MGAEIIGGKKGTFCPFQLTVEILFSLLTQKQVSAKYHCEFCKFFDEVLEVCVIEHLKNTSIVSTQKTP